MRHLEQLKQRLVREAVQENRETIRGRLPRELRRSRRWRATISRHYRSVLGPALFLVAIVFILFSALARDQPDWVRNARSYDILTKTQEAIESLLPMDPEQFLPGPKEEGPGAQPEGQPEAPEEPQPDQRT